MNTLRSLFVGAERQHDGRHVGRRLDGWLWWVVDADPACRRGCRRHRDVLQAQVNGWPDPATAVWPLACGPLDSNQGGLRVDRHNQPAKTEG